MVEKRPATKDLLWQNVLELMKHHYGKENLNRLARDTGVGPGSASRIKARNTSVGLEVLDKIAAHFKLEPWHLLLPKLDPSNPPVFMLTEVEERLYKRLKRVQEVLVKDD